MKTQRLFFPLPAIAASVMMRRTSFSIWELLQISSQVPLTSICSAITISCLWLGTTKLITYDWSLKNDQKESTRLVFFINTEREIQLGLQKYLKQRKTQKSNLTWIQKSVRDRVRGIVWAGFTCWHRHRCCLWVSSSSERPPLFRERRTRPPAISPGPSCGL